MDSTAQKKDDVKLHIEGMSCTNCALGVSRFLEKQGAGNVAVDFASSEARFTIDRPSELQNIKKGIEKLGYAVVDEETGKSDKWLTLNKKLYISAIFSVPLLLAMFVPWSFLHNPVVQLVLCLPVYAIGFWHFGRSAWSSLKTGIPNMDVLIIIGASAAFLYSLTGTIMNLGPAFMFYETAATIITLVLLGNLIEHKSVKQTSTAIRELSQLQAVKAKVIDQSADGSEAVREVDVKDLQKGQLVLANTGDKISADGIIKWGDATIDESMMTGESVPVDKETDDNVVGGTIVTRGSIKFEIVAFGNDSYLSQVIELVKKAQQDKPEIQRLADRVSAIFVPVVVGIAILTFLLAYFAFDITASQSLLQSVAVLVIACPCAMGLATPTAVMVGLGRITKKGVLIKGANTIEQLANIKQIVFDKTGTLTTGEFSIKKISALSESEEIVKSIIYSIEKHSSHPIAQSITKRLSGTKEMALSKTTEKKGIGILAEDKQGNQYELCSYNGARNYTDDASHDIYLIKNKRVIGTVDIADEIRPDAAEIISYLKKKGIKTVLLSGDNYTKCAHVAMTLGIENFYFGKLPDEKLQIIEQLSKNLPTAMIGDGINDAPALAKATIGISLSGATEVAIDSAQVILLKGNLGYLRNAIELCEQTLKTIKQNLFWAFSYNLVAIPIAAIGLLNPMVAALSMAFSDVMVIGNSLRLKIKKIT